MRDAPQDDPMPYGVNTIPLRITLPAAPAPQGYNGRAWGMRPLRGWTGGQADESGTERETVASSPLPDGGSNTTEVPRVQSFGGGLAQDVQFAPGRVRPLPAPSSPFIPGTPENEYVVRSIEDLIKAATESLKATRDAIGKVLHAQEADEPPKPKEPEKVSPSGEAATPSGPEDPDGNQTQSSQRSPVKQQESRPSNNRIYMKNHTANAKNGGVLAVEEGTYTESELRAAQYRADQGNNVLLRQPKGTRAGGGTSDLLVNGRTNDVYTPETNSVDRIVSNVASKNSQAQSVVVELSQTDVTADQLANILARVRGAGATNIQKIIVIPR